MRNNTLGARRKGLVAALAVIALAGCGENGETGSGSAQITALFPNESEQRQIHSIHVWALSPPVSEEASLPPPRLPSSPRASTACGNLVGHALSPYDRYFTLVADRVFFVPDDVPPVLEELPAGEVIVYLEAVDFLGISRFAGCAELELAEGGSATVEIEVVRPGTFDCADPAVGDNAPCDDGSRCTVGEHCRAGACTGGRERSCDSVRDACNSAECTEDGGCQPVPLPDGTSCDAQSQCTEAEVCNSGVCIGAPVDCAARVLACEIAACDVDLGCLVVGQREVGTPCDDDDICTVETSCDSFAQCLGVPRDCTEAVGVCEIADCNQEDGCHAIGNRTSGSPCDDDICFINQQCNAEGNCVGGTERNCAAELTLDVCEAAGCDSDNGCHPDGPAEGTPCDPAVPCDLGQEATCDGTAIGIEACVCSGDNGGSNSNGGGNGGGNGD